MLRAVFPLAVAPPAVSLHAADTALIDTAETRAGSSQSVSSRGLTRGQPSSQNAIQVDTGGLRNDKGAGSVRTLLIG